MGPNAGHGMSGMEMGSNMHGQSVQQPQGTEYTLQGVMRFLQTEWHRHERDRNAWEIDRQEMKGRIASLEGQARRADATQKALKKYVAILERKVKDQAIQLKGPAAAEEADAEQEDRATKIQEKLKSAAAQKLPVPGVEGLELDPTDDEAQRQDLKGFLDQCQSEFMYLMISPANPQPPRDSPPLPMIEDLREIEALGMQHPQAMDRQYPIRSAQQNHVQEMNSRQNPAPNHVSPLAPNAVNFPPTPDDLQAQAMMRSQADNQPVLYTPTTNEWQPSVTTRAVEEPTPEPYQAAAALGSLTGHGEKAKSQSEADNDGWEFPEGTFPEPGTAQMPNNVSGRPDTDAFPNADNIPKSPNRLAGSHRRKGSMSRRRSSTDQELSQNASQSADNGNFKLRFGLRGHLDTVRTVIFSGGGSPGEPEICTAGDDGTVKRFHIPRLDSVSGAAASDLDVTANFTHRGHAGAVLALTSWSPSPNFSTGGRAQGDGWIFSGGQDATVRVWERGRVDPKATLEGHTDAVWALCVLPTTLGTIFGTSSSHGSADRILLVSGGADGSVRVWSVSAPPQLSSPQPGSNRGMSGRGGRVRGNSMSSGSGFSNTPQPNMASNSPFNHTLVHNIRRTDGSDASPTSIAPLSPTGETFVVSFSDAAVIVYDTKTGDQLGSMDSMETYDRTLKTSINAVVATTMGLDQAGQHHSNGMVEEDSTGGPTGGGRAMAGSGVEGTIISGHEDCYVRFFDANSGQCTYNMLAHPDAISSLSLSPDGRELVSAGHDASLRFWSLEKRACTQEITSHRVMRGEGVCSCVWSQDGKWVVSGGGDGLVKVFAR